MPGKTLDELEGVVWGESNWSSSLVETCHRLRKKPVDEFTVEDLRIMIGQAIGLPYLMPIAVTILESVPLAEGDYYPGDLLTSVVSNREWLQRQPLLQTRIVTIVNRALTDGRDDPDLCQRLRAFLEQVGCR